MPLWKASCCHVRCSVFRARGRKALSSSHGRQVWRHALRECLSRGSSIEQRSESSTKRHAPRATPGTAKKRHSADIVTLLWHECCGSGTLLQRETAGWMSLFCTASRLSAAVGVPRTWPGGCGGQSGLHEWVLTFFCIPSCTTKAAVYAAPNRGSPQTRLSKARFRHRRTLGSPMIWSCISRARPGDALRARDFHLELKQRYMQLLGVAGELFAGVNCEHHTQPTRTSTRV